MEEERSVFTKLTGKLSGKRLLGRFNMDERKILKIILKIVINTRNWTNFFGYFDYWRIFVYAALKLQVP